MKKKLILLIGALGLLGCTQANTKTINNSYKKDFIERANFVKSDKFNKFNEKVGTKEILILNTKFSNSAVIDGDGRVFLGFYKDEITINFINYDQFEDYEFIHLYLKNERGEKEDIKSSFGFIEDGFNYGNNLSKFLTFIKKSKNVKVYAEAHEYSGYDYGETYNFEIKMKDIKPSIEL